MPEDDPSAATVHSMQGSQTPDTPQQHPRRPTVHYPEEIAHIPSAEYTTPSKLDQRVPSFASTDEEDVEEDSDWSSDDLENEEAKFNKQMGVNLRAKRWSVWRVFTLLFSSLIGSVILAGILVTPALVVHFVWYKPHPTSYRHYVDLNIEAWLFWAAANIVISWGLALIVDIIPAVTRILISISWGHVSEEVKSHIESYDSIKDTFKPVLYATGAWFSWVIVFQNIFGLYNSGAPETSVAPYTVLIDRVVEFFFFLVLVVSAQRMLSHAIALAFHRTAYRDRLQELKFGLQVIEKLREYKPSTQNSHNRFSGARAVFNLSFPHHRQRGDNVAQGHDGGHDADIEDNKGRGTQSELHTTYAPPDSPKLEDLKTPSSSSPLDPSHEKQDLSYEYPPSHQRAVSHQEGRNPAVRAARAFKSALFHDARHIKRDDNENPSRLRFSVNSANEAKRIAREIYRTFRDRHRKYLTSADFRPAFATAEGAQEAFRVFDKDDNGDISRSEVKATVVRIYNERRFLSRSIHDVGMALKSLDRILLFFALVILFFISLSVFGINITHSLSSMYALGFALSFIFKNTASDVFDAIIFLFVTHPFDTGDRCFIGPENLVVKKMGLLATVFERSDGTETYYSNSQLFTKFITNVRRSDKMVEPLEMQIAWRTPLEKLEALEARLNDWLMTEEKRWFQPTTSINLEHISFQNHLQISITIPHNSTWQDSSLRKIRTTAFHAAVQYYCRQLGITACQPPLPLVFVGPDTQPTPEAQDSFDGYSGGGGGSAKSFLGFMPPDQTQQRLQPPARKSRSRKTAMRGIGADGGDGGNGGN